MAEGVGDPGVAEAVDGHAARDETDLDLLGLAGIVCRKARHRVAAVGDPDPILLIHGEMEGPLDLERAVDGLAIHMAPQDAAVGGVLLGQMDDLALLIVKRPDVAIQHDNDPLHRTQLSSEVVAALG